MKHRKVEILAPAGSFDSMKAAISAGADAVYIGGSRFGARAYADNLEEKQMLEAIDYAHLHGVSLYLTVNTLMKEREMGELFQFLNPYYRQGLDGVIVQDLGAVSYIRRQFPDLAVHASTQMTVTGVYGARLLSRLGVTRIVAARELSLDELRRIHEETPVEIEAFVHGALCYCYSGQCLLSSFIGGRSGNRGRCAQPCRLPYTVTDMEQKTEEGRKKNNLQEQQYLLSMKDLCALELIPQLMEAGVSSFKIEGRMKSPRYTAGVVRTYRKYVDLYLQKGMGGYWVDPQDKEQLLDLFYRGGFTQGYYQQHNGPEMIVRKEKPSFRPGNEKLFDELDRLYIKEDKKIPISGILTVKEGQAVGLQLWISDGKLHDLTVAVYGQRAETAMTQPAAAEQLARQIKKTGNTLFEFQKLEVQLDGKVFLPLKALNELRRNGLDQLKKTILNRYQRDAESLLQEPLSGMINISCKTDSWVQIPISVQASPKEETSRTQKPKLHILLSGKEAFEWILNVPEVQEIMMEADALEPVSWKDFSRKCHKSGKRCVLAMPVIFRNQAEKYFDKWLSQMAEAEFDGILVRALEEIEYLKERKIVLPVYSDHNLYSFNHISQEMLAELGCERITLPLELNSRELESLGKGNHELIVYGFLPAMVSAQCVQKTISKQHSLGHDFSNQRDFDRLSMGRCTKNPGWLMLKDRTGKELPVKTHCTYCYNIIYNPDVLSLLGQKDRIKKLEPQAVRLQFTRESADEIQQVVNGWVEELYGKESTNPKEKEYSGQKSKTEKILSGGFTRGHFKRGVE